MHQIVFRNDFKNQKPKLPTLQPSSFGASELSITIMVGWPYGVLGKHLFFKKLDKWQLNVSFTQIMKYNKMDADSVNGLAL
jgi:hypothetical protein